MIEWTKDMNLSGTLQTELFRVMTQLLWLSQAILLSKVHPLTPEAWIAYLTSDGAIYARNINHALNNWLLRSLKEHGIELGQLGRLAQRLDSILGNLAPHVFFAIDEAQIAETLFPEVEFTALNSERRYYPHSFIYLKNQLMIFTAHSCQCWYFIQNHASWAPSYLALARQDLATCRLVLNGQEDILTLLNKELTILWCQCFRWLI